MFSITVLRRRGHRLSVGRLARPCPGEESFRYRSRLAYEVGEIDLTPDGWWRELTVTTVTLLLSVFAAGLALAILVGAFPLSTSEADVPPLDSPLGTVYLVVGSTTVVVFLAALYVLLAVTMEFRG